MKPFILFLITFLQYICFSQTTLNKKTTYTTIDCDKEISQNPERKITKVEFFTINGKLLRESYMNNDSSIKSETVYKYDLNDNIVLKENYLKLDTSTTRYINSYNSNNKLASVVTGNKTTIFEYNKEGNIRSEINKYDDGHETKTLYTYNKSGNCLTKRSHGFKMVFDIDYTYNDKNLLVEESTYRKTQSDTLLYSKYSFEYDQNQNILLERFEGGIDKQSDVKYRYTYNGLLKEKIKDDSSILYNYNEKGSLISIKTNPMRLYHTLTEFEYE